jgi:hypothetical protein
MLVDDLEGIDGLLGRSFGWTLAGAVSADE